MKHWSLSFIRTVALVTANKFGVRRAAARPVRSSTIYATSAAFLLPSVTIGSSPVDVLLRDYEKFLRSERGLAPATLKNYLPIVQRFLVDRSDSHVLRFDELRAADLHGFIIRSAQRGSLGRAKLMVTAMRSFLRFLRQRGILSIDLAAAMPGVANWRLSHLPKTLPPHQVEQLLASCDRDTPAGQRDYAILLLLARLGLRGGEVVAMTLDDLIWECGEIVVRGKGQRLARMPLPPDVGSALANLSGVARSSGLRDTSGLCPHARAAVRPRVPSTICCIVRRALKRATRSDLGFQRRASAASLPGHRTCFAEAAHLSMRSANCCAIANL